MKNNIPIEIKPGYIVSIKGLEGKGDNAYNTIVFVNEKGKFCCGEGSCCFELNDFNNPEMENREWHGIWAITHVWGYPANIEHLCRYDKINDRPLLWERTMKMTKREIEELIGCKIEIVEE